MKFTFAFRNDECFVKFQPGTTPTMPKPGAEVSVERRDGGTTRVVLERIVRREGSFVFYSFESLERR